MSLNHVIELMGIVDAKFTPEGGTSVDIYGIQDLKIDYDFVDKEARGDDTILAYFSKIDSASVDLSQAALDLDTLGAITGNTVTDTGATPSQTATLQIKAGSIPYGTLEGQGTLIEQNGTGDKVADVHFKVMKMKINKLGIDAKSEDVLVVSGTGKAIPDSNGVIIEITLNETETDIT